MVLFVHHHQRFFKRFASFSLILSRDEFQCFLYHLEGSLYSDVIRTEIRDRLYSSYFCLMISVRVSELSDEKASVYGDNM